MSLAFVKAHGLGNDFVIMDARVQPVALSAVQVQRIADRHHGVGCDQLVILDAPDDNAADVRVRFYNADGTESGACGNASRCIGWLEMQRTGASQVTLQTRDRLLQAKTAGDKRVQVNMDMPGLHWQQIPLRQAVETLRLPLVPEGLQPPTCVSMGNPHAVFFVPDVMAVDLHRLGPLLEHDAWFPERANIGMAEVVDRQNIRLRVWERGAGETQACGTGACAAQVAARRLGLTDAEAWVHLPGGSLSIRWEGSEQQPMHPVWMTGDIAVSFSGVLDESLL